ncbi:glucan biosynthesis protein G [Methylothermus subterraneus]
MRVVAIGCCFWIWLGLLGVEAVEGQPVEAVPAVSDAGRFGFETVQRLARDLASRPYARDEADLPEALAKLDYDQYRDIRFKPEFALWREEGLPFQVQFFHRGFLYRDRVIIHVVEDGKPRRLDYVADWFDFGKNALGPFDPNLGFAGFRLHFPLKRNGYYDEVALFQGASYFRAVGLDQAYGLSARGLAIDTGLLRAEEFPVFREFWIEKPQPDANAIVVYALLDSPAVAGAYRFVIRPGLESVMDVESRLYFRHGVERLGIAPLTSMFFRGENTEYPVDDFRPEIHDSDGLAIARGNGEWLWRPLNNPRQLRISVFHDEHPKGFGLIQRDRNFDHYQDLEAIYQRRPSAWVEPLGDWGSGAIYLIEIPSDHEKYDNIVAFWMPDEASAEGQEMAFAYRLYFTLDERLPKHLGWAEATRIGAAGVDPPEPKRRRFVIDFSGQALRRYPESAKLEAQVDASAGAVDYVVVQKNFETGAWRLSFELDPGEAEPPIELRAWLRSGKEALTETWLYQWGR